MLQNLGSCTLLEGFTNFSVDPYYDQLSLVMIIIEVYLVALWKIVVSMYPYSYIS